MLPVRGKRSLKGCFNLKKLAKLFALILALALVLTLAACKKDATEAESVDVTEQYLGAYRMDSINGVSVRDAMLLEYGSEDNTLPSNFGFCSISAISSTREANLSKTSLPNSV